MDFVAIVVETANPDVSTICLIGMAGFRDGQLVAEWQTLVDPQTWFEDRNIRKHGIDSQAVVGAPTFPEVVSQVVDFAGDAPVVCHTLFDRGSVSSACFKYGLPPLAFSWLDSSRVVRQVWSEFAQRGYGLSNICEVIGYSFKHHDALEDAKAAGHVMLEAARISGIAPHEWLVQASAHASPSSGSSHVTAAGNPDGSLFGEVLVFTGSLSMLRRDAAALAADAGCEVADNVNGKTTLLVVGDQDIAKLAGHDKSTKHRKAEGLIDKGQEIRILGESDFLALTRL
ncbi:MAG: exonuclease domain-containing protein [Coriobacteriia bacterium]|nr:exonuclease domain-containing protein [Coriobacteriia bacterium]